MFTKTIQANAPFSKYFDDFRKAVRKKEKKKKFGLLLCVISLPKSLQNLNTPPPPASLSMYNISEIRPLDMSLRILSNTLYVLTLI